MYQRVLRIREQLLGAEHPAIAHPLFGLAVILHDQGNHKQAEALYRRGLIVQGRQSEAANPDIEALKRSYDRHLDSIGTLVLFAPPEYNDEPSV
jgi:hypothetical protein